MRAFVREAVAPSASQAAAALLSVAAGGGRQEARGRAVPSTRPSAKERRSPSVPDHQQAPGKGAQNKNDQAIMMRALVGNGRLVRAACPITRVD